LSFCGEAGHFIDDRFFLTAIQTQGLLLFNAVFGCFMNLGPRLMQRPTVRNPFVGKLEFLAAGSPSALAARRGPGD